MVSSVEEAQSSILESLLVSLVIRDVSTYLVRSTMPLRNLCFLIEDPSG